GAASAGRLGVRVAHGEVAAHQLVGEIELGAGEQVEAHRIDQHGGAGALDHQVIRLLRPVELEAVLEAAATAGQDGDAQRLRLPLGGDDFGDAGGGPLRHGELFHAAEHKAAGGRIEAMSGAV